MQNARAAIIFVSAFDVQPLSLVELFVDMWSSEAKQIYRNNFKGCDMDVLSRPGEVRTKTLGGVEKGEDREDVDVG